MKLSDPDQGGLIFELVVPVLKVAQRIGLMAPAELTVVAMRH
jgi:hypothetical protein